MKRETFASYHFTVFIILIGFFTSCHKKEAVQTTLEPNYSDAYYWASLAPSIEKEVDVFYVYPTLFGGTGEMNMDITDVEMRTRVQAVLPKQSAVFKEDCNIFVPYYRQMAMDALYLEETESDKYFSMGLADVEEAFDYYMNNLNNGRPFILAGHSQGSMVLIQLMKDKFNHTELINQLVAAYVIGYSVTDDDLADCDCLKIAESADDIGTIITYNTQSEFATGSPVLLANAYCVNPLNWKNTSEYASKEKNLGAVFFKQNGAIDSIVPQFTDAYIDANGALVAETADVNSYSMPSWPPGVYHKYDYSFFFNNLIENVGVRIEAYQKKNKKH